MGNCWNCGSDVFLKNEEVHCDNCKKIVRYWCNSCGQPFDVLDKESKLKLVECKWCGFFKCPHCQACSPTCSKFEHEHKIKEFLNGFIPIDKWKEIDKAIEKIVNYFEEVKMGKEKTTCAFGVPKTYAKERIKQILARMQGFKVRDVADQKAFEKRYEETLDKPIGYEFTIGRSRESGSYGQEYRDVFNFCICMGELEYKKKKFKNDKDIEIEYDSWTRIQKGVCPFLNKKDVIVKYCPECKTVYPRGETYCPKCIYPKGGKNHAKGSHFNLIEKLSNIPTCKNLSDFKKRGNDGQGKP